MSVFEQIVKTRHIPHWLFDKGTRVVEVLNSLFLIGFASTFIYNFDGILSLPSYRAFAIDSSVYWWGADWNSNGRPREKGETDSPHFEI